jgi:uncharacterized membrane protein (UPF0182 family)
MYRTVTQRVRQIAPFFTFDRDPYMVIDDDGRQIWMLDGYTTTDAIRTPIRCRASATTSGTR